MSAWPSIACNARKLAPPASKWVAKAWRRDVRTDLCRIDPRFGGQFADDLKQPNAADMHIALACCLGGARREQIARFLGHKGMPDTHRLSCAIRYGNKAFFTALTGQYDKWPVAHDRGSRQYHQFRGTQPRAVEQFDQRRQAIVERRRLWFGQPRLDRLEQRLDFFLIKDFGQTALLHGPWQRRRRIVRAQPFLFQKAEKSAQRSGLARDRAGRQMRPCRRPMLSAFPWSRLPIAPPAYPTTPPRSLR